MEKNDYRERLYGKPSQEQSEKESKKWLSSTYENQRRTQNTEQETACGTLGKCFSAHIISRPKNIINGGMER
jgi:hypothetical protein